MTHQDQNQTDSSHINSHRALDCALDNPPLKSSQEDGPCIEPIQPSTLSDLKKREHTVSIDPIKRLIQKEINANAQRIGIESSELQAWIDMQLEVPLKSILALLRIARQYHLDPLQDEVFITPYEDHWHTSISMDGWIKLIHRHPAFTGMAFTQSPGPDQAPPLWMECTIYRSDRTVPTTIREYLLEVKQASDIWEKMPRRMLRHRTLQQCARVAMGLGVTEFRESKPSSNTKSLPGIKTANARPHTPGRIKQRRQSDVLKQFLQTEQSLGEQDLQQMASSPI
jgi:hypothetical protein